MKRPSPPPIADPQRHAGLRVHSPPFLHAQHVRIALDAGRSVLCDKPFTPSADESRRLVDDARDAPGVHLLNFEFRFDPMRERTRDLVAAGVLGTVEHVVWTHHSSGSREPLRPYGWLFDRERGGGWIGAWASHAVDTLRFTFAEIESVVRSVPRLTVTERPDPDDPDGPLPCTAEDGLSALLLLDGGATVTIDSSFAASATLAAADHGRRERRNARERRRSAHHRSRRIGSAGRPHDHRCSIGRPSRGSDGRVRRRGTRRRAHRRGSARRGDLRRRPRVRRSARSLLRGPGVSGALSSDQRGRHWTPDRGRLEWICCSALGRRARTPCATARLEAGAVECEVGFGLQLVPRGQVEGRIGVGTGDDDDRPIEARVGGEGCGLRLLERGGRIARRALLDEREARGDPAVEPVEVGAAAERRQLLAEGECVVRPSARVERERERAPERVARAVVVGTENAGSSSSTSLRSLTSPLCSIVIPVTSARSTSPTLSLGSSSARLISAIAPSAASGSCGAPTTAARTQARSCASRGRASAGPVAIRTTSVALAEAGEVVERTDRRDARHRLAPPVVNVAEERQRFVAPLERVLGAPAPQCDVREQHLHHSRGPTVAGLVGLDQDLLMPGGRPRRGRPG